MSGFISNLQLFIFLLKQPCLGGDSKTLMFVNISLDSTSSGESLCSLRFAARVNACEVGVPRRHMGTRSFESRLSYGWLLTSRWYDSRFHIEGTWGCSVSNIGWLYFCIGKRICCWVLISEGERFAHALLYITFLLLLTGCDWLSWAGTCIFGSLTGHKLC